MSPLTVLLFLASCIGCFPARMSLTDPMNLEFKLFHPITLYTLILLVTDILIAVDSRGIPTFSEIRSSYTYLCLCNRLKVGESCKENQCFETSSEGIGRKDKTSNRANNYGQLSEAIFLVEICQHFLNHVSILREINKPNSFIMEQEFFFLPTASWVPKVVFLLNNVLISTSQAFIQALTIVLAAEIGELYVRIRTILIRKFTCVGLPRDNDFKDEIILYFKQLKHLCHLYSEDFGNYVLIALSSMVLAIGQLAFIFASNTEVLFLSRFISCSLGVYCIIKAGDVLEKEIQRGGESLQDATINSSDKPLNENLREVVVWMSTWTYKLTAGNVITVSMRLIPGVVGTVMTYVIFLFQLTLSGDGDRI
ncbi:unnamed protein product [Allacma fusca]|uniref:Gustatory receptor n=1 Tax=Allacma fusca TaxID=39272 RepID=A0A8J2LTA6_9HEXA|nr:unnamed protein product [Allacma fusca]